MTVDLAAARSFLAGHARLLDRHRFDLLLGDGPAVPVLAALAAHRNADGGYGWGLEPDLRGGESQPAGAMHALLVLAEAAEAGAEVTGPALELLDWVAARTLVDGGLPFALPLADPTACSPFWVSADPTASVLMMTCQVAAAAHALAAHDPAVAGHRWLGPATDHALAAIGRMDGDAPAYDVSFALRLLDAVGDRRDEVPALVAHLGAFLPDDGRLPVAGGTPDEALHLLNLSPRPDAASSALFGPEVRTADLDRLAAGQQADGGWTVDHDAASPIAALEWRGMATVEALRTLRAHGR